MSEVSSLELPPSIVPCSKPVQSWLDVTKKPTCTADRPPLLGSPWLHAAKQAAWRCHDASIADLPSPADKTAPLPPDAFDDECPLCTASLDDSERSFFPCPCGFQLCAFCYHHISQDRAAQCPGCRRPYHATASPDSSSDADLALARRLQAEEDARQMPSGLVATAPTTLPPVRPVRMAPPTGLLSTIEEMVGRLQQLAPLLEESKRRAAADERYSDAAILKQVQV